MNENIKTDYTREELINLCNQAIEVLPTVDNDSEREDRLMDMHKVRDMLQSGTSFMIRVKHPWIVQFDPVTTAWVIWVVIGNTLTSIPTDRELEKYQAANSTHAIQQITTWQ